MRKGVLMEVDYGPLTGLIGTFNGDKGIDIAPDREDGKEENLFYETIVFSKAGEVVNADEQRLAALHYHQVVTRKSDDAVIHNQTGYWMWDKERKLVIQSIAIPRAVCLLASGAAHTGPNGETVIKVISDLKHEHWSIIQSPFMDQKAKTIAFDQKLTINGDELHYFETTLVDIYGHIFEHTDTNTLKRVK